MLTWREILQSAYVEPSPTAQPREPPLVDLELLASKLDRRRRAWVRLFTQQALAQQGYINVREGSRTWDNAQYQVLRKLIEQGMDPLDVPLSHEQEMQLAEDLEEDEADQPPENIYGKVDYGRRRNIVSSTSQELPPPPAKINKKPDATTEMEEGEWYCNFCLKKRVEVAHLITNGVVCICNECIAACSDMLPMQPPLRRSKQRWVYQDRFKKKLH